MDNPNQRRRQHEQPIHHTPTQRYSLQGPSAGSSAERYRPVPSSASPSTPRGMGGTASYSSTTFYPEPVPAFSTSTNMPATGLAYEPDYGTGSRSQTQSFGYTTSMMYNVPQPSTQTSVYDAQQFGQRQQAIMQMMPPDVTPTYFNPEAGAAVATSMQHSAQATGTSAGVYQQTQPMNYTGNIPGTSAMQQATGAADTSMGDDQHYDGNGIQERWVEYQQQLWSVFENIKRVSLESAAETLLSISDWLLPRVADLGLSQDDADLHKKRIQLWDDFNHAWLALGFRQKEVMLAGQQLSRSQTLMSPGTIKKMGDELIRLCDGIERYGLVDYQYGVLEDQIEAVLEECLDLYESSEEVAGASGGGSR